MRLRAAARAARRPRSGTQHGVMPKGLLHDGEKGNFTVEHPWCAAAHAGDLPGLGKRADGRARGTRRRRRRTSPCRRGELVAQPATPPGASTTGQLGGLRRGTPPARSVASRRASTNHMPRLERRRAAPTSRSDYAMYWDQAGDCARDLLRELEDKRHRDHHARSRLARVDRADPQRAARPRARSRHRWIASHRSCSWPAAPLS